MKTRFPHIYSVIYSFLFLFLFFFCILQVAKENSKSSGQELTINIDSTTWISAHLLYWTWCCFFLLPKNHELPNLCGRNEYRVYAAAWDQYILMYVSHIDWKICLWTVSYSITCVESANQVTAKMERSNKHNGHRRRLHEHSSTLQSFFI